MPPSKNLHAGSAQTAASRCSLAMQAEYARAVREVVKEILRSHTVPRLAAEADRPLWQHFVAETVTFERKLAEVPWRFLCAGWT